MTAESVVSQALVNASPVMTLHYLCREVVHAEANARLWERHGVWDKAEWWEAYGERLYMWLYAHHRGNGARLHVCPACGRIHENLPGYLTCFSCGAHWIARV